MGTVVTLQVGPLATANAALYAASQTPVSGTPLTLTGTLPDVPRKVLLTFGSEASARTMVIVGTSDSGGVIQETLAIPASSAGTVATIQNFASVTKATPLGGGWSAAVTLGTSGVGGSPWKIINAPMWGPTEVSFNVTATGTVNWSIVLTNTNLYANQNQIGGAFGPPSPPVPNVYAAPTALTGGTGNAQASVNDPFFAWQAVINSGAGSIVVEAIEAGAH